MTTPSSFCVLPPVLSTLITVHFVNRYTEHELYRHDNGILQKKARLSVFTSLKPQREREITRCDIK